MSKKKSDKTTAQQKQDSSKKAKQQHDEQVDLETLSQQIDELQDSLKRERADSENIRRRHEAQLSELKTYVTVDIIRSLLPVIDNMERAQQHVPEDIADSQYVKGVESVLKQFATTLEKLGVERISTAGEEFDPELHEAVSMDDSEGGATEIVTDELQTGYKLDSHVIRHAMVNVKTTKK